MKTLQGVDGERMVLWGTSLSGGHVVCMAALGHRIAAVIAGHPLMRGLGAVAHMPHLKVLKLTFAGLRDLAGSLIGKPHYLPVVGRPGDFAVLTGPEAWGGMQELQAIVDVPWENKVLARVALKIPRYNPIRKARGVRVPTLVIAGSKDIVSAQVAQKAAERMPNARFTLHASDHFQPYYGDYLDENVRTQLAFLRKHVAV